MKSPYQTIERGSRGATYQNDMDTFTVYEHSVYPRHSVLAGQHRRRWLGEFGSLDEARAAFPKAEASMDSYAEPSLAHLPNNGDY